MWRCKLEYCYSMLSAVLYVWTGYLNYIDACAEGLQQVSSQLRFGVPGGACHEYRSTSFCWAVLSHCQGGRNFFTGAVGTNISFISIHAKV